MLYLVEVVKLDAGHGSPDSGGDGFTGISDEVGYTEEFGRLLMVLLAVDLKVPGERQQVVV